MATIGLLVLVVLQLIFLAGLVLVWMKVKKNGDDDSRWSRGLQYIQSKIAIFEDLGDRTEHQVQQLTTMMENKICDLQRKIDEADDLLSRISSSMKKSMEVAQIFQDKIPHEEILERQNTVKFVKAALLAHDGRTLEEISQLVDLPAAQIEFIIKVNSRRLSFDLNQMPQWLKMELCKEDAVRATVTEILGEAVEDQPFEMTRLQSKTPSKFPSRSTLRPLEEVLRDRVGGSLHIDFDDSHRGVADETPAPATENVSATPAVISSSSEKVRTEREEIMDLLPPVAEAALVEDLGLDVAKKATSTDTTQSQGLRMAQGALERKAKELGIRPVIFPRIETPR